MQAHYEGANGAHVQPLGHRRNISVLPQPVLTILPGVRNIKDALGIWTGKRQFRVLLREDESDHDGYRHPPASYYRCRQGLPHVCWTASFLQEVQHVWAPSRCQKLWDSRSCNEGLHRAQTLQSVQLRGPPVPSLPEGSPLLRQSGEREKRGEREKSGERERLGRRHGTTCH